MFRRVNPCAALQSNPFVLAPMAGITDHPFRTFMHDLGASVVVSELVSATGLEYKSARTQALMSFDDSQRPVAIQLFGENPTHMAHAAQLVEHMGADFVDVNFGCPVPKVVKKGAGSAMLRDLPAMAVLLQEMVKAVKIPVTIKIRTGWDADTRNAHQVVQVAADAGIAWVAIHGRTRAQAYEGLADWDYIGDVKAKAQIPILGNGDIATASQAVEKLKLYNLDGVMIGRGALKNPLIFRQALELWQTGATAGPYPSMTELFLALHKVIAARCDERITQIQLKKFAAWYSTGYPGAAQFRKQIFQVDTTESLLKVALDFLQQLNNNQKESPNHEGFLMGGHG